MKNQDFMRILKNNTLLIVSFILLLTSCKEKKTVYVQIGQSEEQIPFSNYLDSIKTISIYGENSIILGDVTKIEKSQNIYYALSQKKDAIYKSDSSGNIIAMLSRLGHSKEEYTQILDFSVDESNNTVVTLCAGPKIMVYDLSFNLKYVKDIKLPCVTMCAFKGNIYCYSPKREIIQVTDEGYDLLLKGEEFPAYIYEGNSIFHKVDDKLLAVMEYDDTIYEIQNGELRPYIIYSYPKYSKTIDRMRKNEIMTEFNDIIEHSSVKIQNMALQNDNLAIIYFYNLIGRICIINVKSKKLVSDGFLVLNSIKWISNNSCIGYEYVKDFDESHAEDKTKIIKVGSDNKDSNLIIEYYTHFM